MHVQSCCFALSIAFFTFSLLLHLKLPTIYDTLWSVRNRIVSVQNAHADSILRFWLEKLGEWTGQLWRDNSPRVRNLEKNSGETVCRLGTIIQSIFCAQSGASIRLTVWKWSGKSRYPWALPPMLENFRRTFSLGPTYCPWVSEDVKSHTLTAYQFFELILTRERNET